MRDTFVIRDASGQEVARIQEHLVSVRDTMEIERGRRQRNGQEGAWSAFAIASPSMSMVARPVQAHGNVVDHEYEIERDGATVATVSKKWFRVRDSYGVEVAPGEDAGLMLAVTVCMDELSR